MSAWSYITTSLRHSFPAPGLNTSILLCTVAVALIGCYIIYQRRFHPLATYPGPFLASITDLWQVREFLQGQQPYHLTDLHHKYGEIVRYGPDKLSITSERAINLIYVKNSKTMPKTDYYHPWGQPGHPNIFNETDNEIHSPRRRFLLKAFSPQTVEMYEPVIDLNIRRLRTAVLRYATDASQSDAFDMNKLLWQYMCDVMTELVYDQSWNLLTDPKARERVDIHALTLWGATSGAWSKGQPIIKFLIALVPHPFAYKVFWQNIGFAIKCAKLVDERAAELAKGIGTDRNDLVTRLIIGSEKSLGDKMTVPDIAVECFSFMVAGIHPPASALTLLLHHLLHNPISLQTVTSEVRSNLPYLNRDDAYKNSTVEQTLPYLKDCLKESFRVTPGFTMPLPRKVTQKEGIIINDQKIPYGTSIAVCNHAFHHNDNIWPQDHTVFDPSRWADPSHRLTELSKLMMHFGAGTRQCIGKVLATSIIHKTLASLLSEFDFELADPKRQQKALNGAFKGVMPHMHSVGISDLGEPLMVRARLREKK